MQRVSFIQYIDVLAYDDLNFACQHIYKFFTLVIVTDTLVILPGFDANQKRLKVFIFSTGS